MKAQHDGQRSVQIACRYAQEFEGSTRTTLIPMLGSGAPSFTKYQYVLPKSGTPLSYHASIHKKVHSLAKKWHLIVALAQSKNDIILILILIRQRYWGKWHFVGQTEEPSQSELIRSKRVTLTAARVGPQSSIYLTPLRRDTAQIRRRNEENKYTSSNAKTPSVYHSHMKNKKTTLPSSPGKSRIKYQYAKNTRTNRVQQYRTPNKK